MLKSDNGKRRPRSDGREAFLAYLDPEVIVALKKLSLDRKTHAYLIVEELVRQHIASSSSDTTI